MSGRGSWCAWALAAAVLATAPLQAGVIRHKTQRPEPQSITPDTRIDDAWIRMHDQLVARARRGGVDVLFLGDSITEGWRGQEAWKQFFEPLRAANFGIAGDRTQHLLWRLQNGELEGIHPKVAVLLIGTNNLTSPDTAEGVAMGIRRVVGELHSREPNTQILLLGIFPRGEKPADPLRSEVRTVNHLIAPLGDTDPHIHFLDIGERFAELDGTISNRIMPDHLHLSAEAYDRWARAIFPRIQQLMNATPGPRS